MTQENTKTIPEGYRENSLGHLVPESIIAEIDKLRDDLVKSLVKAAEEKAVEISNFKLASMSEISRFVELSAMEYKVSLGGDKGNLTLTSFDGKFRVVRAIDESICFNEGMTTARELIFKCIEKWSAGADPHLSVLVSSAFETDKNGHIATSRILALRSYNIDDDDWRTAMEMIAKSIQVQATVHYLRFYRKTPGGRWAQVSLDPALAAG